MHTSWLDLPGLISYVSVFSTPLLWISKQWVRFWSWESWVLFSAVKLHDLGTVTQSLCTSSLLSEEQGLTYYSVNYQHKILWESLMEWSFKMKTKETMSLWLFEDKLGHTSLSPGQEGTTWIWDGWLGCSWSLSLCTWKIQWLPDTVVRTHHKFSLQADHHGHQNVSSSPCFVQTSNLKFSHWSCGKVREKVWCIRQVDYLPAVERRIQPEEVDAPYWEVLRGWFKGFHG